MVALFLFIVQPAVTSIFRRSGQGFVFESDSMAPTLLNHDYVMANKTVTRRERGEVIVFEPPAGSTRPRSIARVIGLPGDRVAVHDGRAIVNDVPLVEPYIEVPRARGYRFGPVSVPNGTAVRPRRQPRGGSGQSLLGLPADRGRGRARQSRLLLAGAHHRRDPLGPHRAARPLA